MITKLNSSHFIRQPRYSIRIYQRKGNVLIDGARGDDRAELIEAFHGRYDTIAYYYKINDNLEGGEETSVNDTSKRHLMIIYNAETNEEITQLFSDYLDELDARFESDYGKDNCTYQIFTKEKQ